MITHPPHFRPSRGGFHPLRLLLPLVATLLGLALPGCEGADDRHVLSLEERGAAEGFTFLDLDRSGARSGGEATLPGVELGFVPSGSRDTVATVTSGEDGDFRLADLLVGSYEVAVGGPVLGDSLVVTAIAPERFHVSPGGTSEITIGISFPVYDIPAINEQSPGTRLYAEGVVLNGLGSLPGSALHLWDGQRALRTVGVANFPHSVGDSVRILGRVSQEGQRRVLSEGQGFRIAEATAPPEPQPLLTHEARGAKDGSLDGALVEVEGAVVSDIRPVDAGIVATASDGSGSLGIRIPNSHLSQAGISSLQPGAVLSVRGILLPGPQEGTWELRTRSGEDLTVEALGGISGQVFFDRNGSGGFDSGDTPLEAVRLLLYRSADLQTPVREEVSQSNGSFSMSTLDVGTYVLEVDESTIPDSLVVRDISPSTIEVPTGGTVEVSVPISHPQVTSTEARALPADRTIFLQGVALNAPGDLGDGSVHLRDGEGALRTLEVTGPVRAGDQLRLRGRTASVAGQTVLTEVTPFVQSAGGVPGAIIVGSGAAAQADGGRLDADAILVREATVTEAQGNQEWWTVRVDDGSGVVDVRIRLAGVGFTPEEAAERFTPGARLDVTGLLIPHQGTSRWRIHPRTGGDLSFLQ